MSAALSTPVTAGRPRLFMPSIAQNVEKADISDRLGRAPSGWRSRAAVWAFNIAATPSCAAAPPPTRAVGVTSAATTCTQRRKAAVTTQEMVAGLKTKGMPIAALADVLDVERKTVYSWLDDGIEANATNYDRLRLVHELLADEADGSLRFFHRFWERMVPNGPSLKDALMAQEIDVEAVRAALGELRPAVTRSMQADAERKASAVKRSPASLLTVHLVAGHRD